MKKGLNLVLIKLITILTIIIIWYIISEFVIKTSLFPSPMVVILSFIEMVKGGVLLKDTFWSLQRITISVIFAILIGVPLGIITARLSLAYNSIGTILNFIKAISPIALVPFVILWFGIGEFSKIFVILYLITTIVWLNTDTGIKNVNILYLWAAKSLGANKYSLIRYIIIPNALPYIVSGIRVAIAWAFIIIVAAEMSGAVYGLGYHIFAYYRNFLIDKMIVNLITLTSIAYFIDLLLLFIIKKRYRWYLTNNEKW